MYKETISYILATRRAGGTFILVTVAVVGVERVGGAHAFAATIVLNISNGIKNRKNVTPPVYEKSMDANTNAANEVVFHRGSEGA